MATIEDIQQIFSTEERMRLLREILNSEQEINAINKKAGVNKGLASIYVRKLISLGVLKKNNGIFLDLNSPMTRTMKILMNVFSLDFEMPKDINIEGIGVYGSYAKGTNTSDSDIDIWIKSAKQPDEEKIAKFNSDLRRKLGNVKLLILTEDRIERLKKDDPVFYYSLLYGSIILKGDNIE